MRLALNRDAYGDIWTLSTLTIDGLVFGVGVEPTDRGLLSTMPLDTIAHLKVPGRTAIPSGIYNLGIHSSPKHGRDVLILLDVPGFRFVEMHEGNDAADTDACICPGLRRNLSLGTVSRSIRAVRWLETDVAGPMAHLRNGDEVTIEITRDATAWTSRRP